MKKKIEYTKGSGNIFEDLGFSEPQEKLAKLDLAIQINELIKNRRLSQAKAATLLNIDQPKISALSKGRLSGFSIERLFRFLNILGQDITINVSPKKSKDKGYVSVALPKKKKNITNSQSANENRAVKKAQVSKKIKKIKT